MGHGCVVEPMRQCALLTIKLHGLLVACTGFLTRCVIRVLVRQEVVLALGVLEPVGQRQASVSGHRLTRFQTETLMTQK